MMSMDRVCEIVGWTQGDDSIGKALVEEVGEIRGSDFIYEKATRAITSARTSG